MKALEYAKQFHKLSKTLVDAYIPRDSLLWPQEWKQVELKEYVNVECFQLPRLLERNNHQHVSYSSVLHKRCSVREFGDLDLTIDELSGLLELSVASRDIAGDPKDSMRRFYPSAGGLNALEFYVVLHRAVDYVPAGVFHYDPIKHSLAKLFNLKDVDSYDEIIDMYAQHTLVSVHTTAVFRRLFQKYNARGYRFAFLEAGHAIQCVAQAAAYMELESYCFGGGDDNLVERSMLEIDGVTESLLHTILIGKS